ncbi:MULTISPECIES: hypothetical protein [unclassified Nostoc]|jgi:hypothetical protein|uniref:hypothetical protein n=1 Tax=unclassified Nostoc TaxID=2593658 RepID=UPI0011BE7296|nr:MULTISPECIES: hypothetical protein [unclassified Nostoc]MBD2512771.1 hypothetical protein [Desmonostoc muscorum FACHB-395]MBE9002272.1 hypothetical protein [Nostoc sp. LEGE 12447]QHG20342.1 hypothetical protein GJB62_30935 [Nostoc sp. ATCC 53789]QHG20839.1 hypothetical protein GJB62_33725 [Nostoc sp. ATCC 53789]
MRFLFLVWLIIARSADDSTLNVSVRRLIEKSQRNNQGSGVPCRKPTEISKNTNDHHQEK